MFVYYSIGLMLCPLADVIAFSVIIGDFGHNICHMAITSAKHITKFTQWLFHLPQGNNISLKFKNKGNNISPKSPMITEKAITSANGHNISPIL